MQMHRRAFLKGLGVAAVTIAVPVTALPKPPDPWFPYCVPIDHPAEREPMDLLMENCGFKTGPPAVEWDGGFLLTDEEAARFIRRLVTEPTLLSGTKEITIKCNDRIICRGKPEDFEWL